MNLENLSERLQQRIEKEKREKEKAIQAQKEKENIEKEKREQKLNELRQRVANDIVNDFEQCFDMDKGLSYLYAICGHPHPHVDGIERDLPIMGQMDYNFDWHLFDIANLVRQHPKLTRVVHHITGQPLIHVTLLQTHDSAPAAIHLHIDTTSYE